jgi:hypothetical protein
VLDWPERSLVAFVCVGILSSRLANFPVAHFPLALFLLALFLRVVFLSLVLSIKSEIDFAAIWE